MKTPGDLANRHSDPAFSSSIEFPALKSATQEQLKREMIAGLKKNKASVVNYSCSKTINRSYIQ